jgi:hypothetical protein
MASAGHPPQQVLHQHRQRCEIFLKLEVGRLFGSGSCETSEAGQIRILTNSATNVVKSEFLRILLITRHSVAATVGKSEASRATEQDHAERRNSECATNHSFPSA